MRYLWGHGRVWKSASGEAGGGRFGWFRGMDVVGAGDMWLLMS